MQLQGLVPGFKTTLFHGQRIGAFMPAAHNKKTISTALHPVLEVPFGMGPWAMQLQGLVPGFKTRLNGRGLDGRQAAVTQLGSRDKKM
jgi:hypothetical protein